MLKADLDSADAADTVQGVPLPRRGDSDTSTSAQLANDDLQDENFPDTATDASICPDTPTTATSVLEPFTETDEPDVAVVESCNASKALADSASCLPKSNCKKHLPAGVPEYSSVDNCSHSSAQSACISHIALVTIYLSALVSWLRHRGFCSRIGRSTSKSTQFSAPPFIL
jgi:hypothetical protein